MRPIETWSQICGSIRQDVSNLRIAVEGLNDTLQNLRKDQDNIIRYIVDVEFRRERLGEDPTKKCARPGDNPRQLS